MTEDEAKTKWCHAFTASHTDPRSRLWQEGDVTLATGGPAYACIGSACMAWRTRHQWLDNAQQNPDWVSYAPYAFEAGEGQERDDGYCGLAGEPQ